MKRFGMLAIALGILMATVGATVAQEATPPEDGAAPVMVGDTEVSWSGAWELDEDATSDAIVTLKIADEASMDIKLATYAEMVDDTVDGAGEALEVFAEAFLSDPGVALVEEVAAGEREDGGVWKVYRHDLGGAATATVFAVTERDDGAFVIATLTATADVFIEGLEDAQREILLDGEPEFLADIDPATALPDATPVATPGG